ncbi:MAG: M23 family metallopeptidase [Anaerolineae bacterium]
MVCLAGVLPGAMVQAKGPDYDVGGDWLLPWRAGDAYRVTWSPKDHWTHGKATGIAYDFGLPTGVPVYAPADGIARFARDDRPLSTTLGNYVDLETPDGWLIRLAHLRDERLETRQVTAGELLGYAGSSGVLASHLHVEILVREDGVWQSPDPTRLTKLFGRPTSSLQVGALIVNGGCTGMLVSDGPARPLYSPIELGEPSLLILPLRNEGERALEITALQVMLESPIGEIMFVDAEGRWGFPSRSLRTVALHAYPDLAGIWQVRGIRYNTALHACDLPLEGRLVVQPLPASVASAAFASSASVGAPIEISVVLLVGSQTLEADDLLVWGTSPSGGNWQATLGEPIRLDPEQKHSLLIPNGPVFDRVGAWRIDGIAIVRRGHSYRLARHSVETSVAGPQLAMETLELYPSATGQIILAGVTNVGNRIAQDIPLEVWGWQGEVGGESVTATGFVSHLEPEQSAVIRMESANMMAPATWRLAGAGCWLNGNYVAISLPGVPYSKDAAGSADARSE